MCLGNFYEPDIGKTAQKQIKKYHPFAKQKGGQSAKELQPSSFSEKSLFQGSRMKAQRSGFHSEEEEQVRATQLFAQREAKCSALDDDAARVSCVCGAKRLKAPCFGGIHFPQSIL